MKISELSIYSHGDEEGKTPGNVLSVDAAKPFRHLQQFGGTFLTRWDKQCKTWSYMEIGIKDNIFLKYL